MAKPALKHRFAKAADASGVPVGCKWKDKLAPATNSARVIIVFLVLAVAGRTARLVAMILTATADAVVLTASAQIKSKILTAVAAMITTAPRETVVRLPFAGARECPPFLVFLYD